MLPLPSANDTLLLGRGASPRLSRPPLQYLEAYSSSTTNQPHHSPYGHTSSHLKLCNTTCTSDSVAVFRSVQFFHDEPTPSLALWAYTIASEAMQHDVHLGRHSWMRFQDRSYHTLAPCRINHRVFDELTLSLPGLQGVAAFVPDFRPTLKASTCSMRETSESPLLATMGSSMMIWSVVTVSLFCRSLPVSMLHAHYFFYRRTDCEKWSPTRSICRRRGHRTRCLAQRIP